MNDSVLSLALPEPIHQGQAPSPDNRTKDNDHLLSLELPDPIPHRQAPSAPSPKKDRVRSAWISFAGRITAQMIGAIATVGLGYLVLQNRSIAALSPVAPVAVPAASPMSLSLVPVRKPGPSVVAVLPLDDYSQSAEPDHFVENMTEALITNLSQSGQIRVISRTSSMHYKARQLPLPQVARELGVDFVVEGSAVRVGDLVRVTAQLIDAHTDEHVWARSYDRNARDVLAAQAELAGVIAHEIGGQLSVAAPPRVAAK